jgi:DNA-binding YbaB/EbfC family protein
MLDMMKMMGKVKEVQEKLRIAQESLAGITASAESGAGLVKATVNGKKKLISLEIDDSLVNIDDKKMLQDLCIAATNKALEEVDIKAKEHLKQSTEGVMPNIPGLDFGSMM